MYLGAHVGDQPDKLAIIQADTGETRTFTELEQNSVRLARHLQGAGVRVGDVVAFLSDNSPEVFEIYWATLRSGMYVTGINHHLTAAEAAYILSDCGAKALLVSASRLPLAREVVELVPNVNIRLVFGGDGTDAAGFGSYRAALASASAEPLAEQPRGSDMLYSSGTTGNPKGIRPALTGRPLEDPQGDTMSLVFGRLFGFDRDTVYYSPAPTYHAAPLRFSVMANANGGTVVLASRFDAEAALRHIDRYRATHSQWVPTMFVRMLKLPRGVRDGYDLSSMRVAIHAAAPCPVEVKRRMMAWWGPVLYEYYSSTESNGVTVVGPDDWLERPGTVGRAGLGVIHICSDDGEELPVGEDGIVYFERDERPFTYHNDDAKTADATHPRNPTWTTTGDIGHVDDGGFLYLTDRAAFTVISGGVNIYPQEIEDALALHPAIYDVAVIGVADEELGEVVKAVVQPAPGVEPTDSLGDEILASLRGRIADFKIPRSLDFTDELPRSATGKLVKRLLIERYG
ncbi:acyl-CoA synthetase [Tsukamurella sp. 8F]|uniref:acyl-CoA synthetase n=1 Tax=unclassified Tsukamurella TaxID=2633480 RepID=UPI0023B8E8C2|nr:MULTISPECIES: acyl-CoA synthetase [unclassified Tsukamurella]MDF0528879.1 acyl-CoA synthetase [Tsukamurella sp. 8J]MDF0586714.1 acyl-CoA synthetase [Tsukamurella sp. 8F]